MSIETSTEPAYLTPAEVYMAMGYYFDHQTEIDQEISQEWQQVQENRNQAERSPFYNHMKARGLL